MTLPAYTHRSKLNALNYRLSQVEVVTQPGPPNAARQPENIISNLKILWYTSYQKGQAVSFLNTPGENLKFTENCVNNCRGRVETQEACDLIRAKDPGLVVYLNGNLPNNRDVANLTPPKFS